MITDETQCDNASNCQWFGQGQLGVCGDAGTGSGICDLVLTENICDIVPGCAWNAGNMACEGA
jgi:hypothetical protein